VSSPAQESLLTSYWLVRARTYDRPVASFQSQSSRSLGQLRLRGGLLALSVAFPVALKSQPVLPRVHRETIKHLNKRDMKTALSRQGWRLTAAFANKCDACLSPSQHLARILIDDGGLTTPCMVLPTGLDSTRYRSARAADSPHTTTIAPPPPPPRPQRPPPPRLRLRRRHPRHVCCPGKRVPPTGLVRPAGGHQIHCRDHVRPRRPHRQRVLALGRIQHSRNCDGTSHRRGPGRPAAAGA